VAPLAFFGHAQNGQARQLYRLHKDNTYHKCNSWIKLTLFCNALSVSLHFSDGGRLLLSPGLAADGHLHVIRSANHVFGEETILSRYVCSNKRIPQHFLQHICSAPSALRTLKSFTQETVGQKNSVDRNANGELLKSIDNQNEPIQCFVLSIPGRSKFRSPPSLRKHEPHLSIIPSILLRTGLSLVIS
jgi:hypothetical protein